MEETKLHIKLGICKVTYGEKELETVVKTIEALKPIDFMTNIIASSPTYMESSIVVKTDELTQVSEVMTKCLRAGAILQIDTWIHDVEL